MERRGEKGERKGGTEGGVTECEMRLATYLKSHVHVLTTNTKIAKGNHNCNTISSETGTARTKTDY